MPPSSLAVVAALAALLAAPAARAEAGAVSTTGFTITHVAPLKAPPARVFEALGRVGEWWNSDHTYSGQAANLALELRPGGCFCERWGSGNGVEHARVIYVAKDAALRLEGGLGPLQDLAVTGVLTIALKPAAAGGGTEMKWVYRVSGAPDPALEKWAQPVDGVLGEQVKRLVALVDGAPR